MSAYKIEELTKALRLDVGPLGHEAAARIEALEAIVEKLPKRIASALFAHYNIYLIDETSGREERAAITHSELNEVLCRFSAAEQAKEGVGT